MEIPKNIETCDDDTLREAFIQSNENARALMDLRFKHFTTFMVLTALLGTAIFQVDDLSNIQGYLPWIAVCLSVLFWLLDYRTSQLQKIEMHNITEYKKALKVPMVPALRLPKTIGASKITNLIFAIIVLSWITVALVGASRSTEKVRSNQRVEQTPKKGAAHP
ncbi:MAG: hypothetical protein V1754_07710 [Pseudomonadota bacterium]